MLQAPLRSNEARRRVSKVQNFAPPVGGWVDQGTELNSQGGSALILENFVPTRNSIIVRGGSMTLDTLSGPVQTLMSYMSGTASKLLAAVGDAIFEVPLAITKKPKQLGPQPAVISIATGFTSALWQYTVMANAADDVKLIAVNGKDGIHVYDPVGGFVPIVSTPVLTGLIDVTNFKGRLWFAEKGTSTLYYGDPLSNMPPTLTPFPVGPFLRKGSSIETIETWSRDGGSGPDDVLVAVSNNGEIVVFAGVDPADDLSLVGVFNGNKPLGPRCLRKMQTDLVYYTRFGPMRLTDIFTSDNGETAAFAPIKDQFIQNAIPNKNATEWDFMTLNSASWAMFNVPVVPPSQIDQYVMNLDTGAWFKITGWNATAMVAHDGYDYIGDAAGRIKIINYGNDDDGNAIQSDFMSAWENFGASETKKFNLAQVTIKSAVVPEITVDMMLNYIDSPPEATPGFSGDSISTPWNISPWNTSPWSGSITFYNEWFGLAGTGGVGAFRYLVNSSSGYHELFNYRIGFEIGDLL